MECELYPYRLQRTQRLSDRDRRQRMNFTIFSVKDSSVQTMDSRGMPFESIVWTDEYFGLSGSVWRHNCDIWASEKPKEIITDAMHASKLCVCVVRILNTISTLSFLFQNNDNRRQLQRHVGEACRSSYSKTTKAYIHCL